MTEQNGPVFDAVRYDAWYDQHSAVFQSEVDVLRMMLPPGESLEVGCGTGRFMSALGISQGVEPDRAMREIALNRGCSVKEGHAERMDFQDGAFSAVLLITTLCFVAEPAAALAEARRVLRPAGNLIIAFIDSASPYGKARAQYLKEAYGAALTDCAGVADLLAKSGFDVLESAQTIFGPIGEIANIQIPEPGCGKGSFAVLKGRKTV
jgi:ubiquinone/menaquinone biosynthesis C-methylase UbiE